ncbi:MAG TPA: lysophospholipid acyltransferase family protein [Anaerolineales bacterium]|nr:lysophospholipid acyltransferase family protein [Anaerolineales bacterium]HNA88795.1 lysophospholipid acyltransferase family protein [Anaerolineales bacterium]HNB35435.1 lysophospholipid acyltransferase family protein [Anaerolineales bacterium]HNC07189.1 lysophospholipid acyltransferase family protein [Anaerolineales bacterium]
MTEVTFLDPRDKLNFSFQTTPFRKFVVFMLGSLFKTIMKLEVQGAENLPTDGPVVLAANHVTNFDVIPMQLSIPRPIFFMGKASLFKIPIFEAAIRDLGAFPVHRGEKDEWALRHAARVLEHGQVLGMFPEGTRSQGKGLRVARTGSARLTLDAGCPIIPMAVIGTDNFFKHFPRRTLVTIKILQPILPKPAETPLALMDRVMFALAKELPPEMRGVYAEVPKGFE